MPNRNDWNRSDSQDNFYRADYRADDRSGYGSSGREFGRDYGRQYSQNNQNQNSDTIDRHQDYGRDMSRDGSRTRDADFNSNRGSDYGSYSARDSQPHMYGSNPQYGSDRSTRNDERSYGGNSNITFGRGNDMPSRGMNERSRGYGSGYGSDYNSNAGQNYGGNSYGGQSYASDYSRNYANEHFDRQPNHWGSDYGSNVSYSTGQGGNYGGDRMFEGNRGRDRFDNNMNRGYGSGYGSDMMSGSSMNQTTNYSGRGPKGWKRSDDRIKEEVCDMLERHHEIDASEVEVDVKEGMVTLRGSVDNRRTKRMAEDVIEHISGVRDVRNELSVNQSLFEMAKEVLTGESTTKTDSKTRPTSKH